VTPAQIGLRDLVQGVFNIPLAMSLALRELRTRFSRTTLGPLWITVAQALWIAGIAFVFSEVFEQDVGNYLYFLASGLPVWTYISTIMTESPTTFISNKGAMEQFGAPWTVQVWKRLTVSALVFWQHMLIWLAALVLTRPPLSFDMLWAIPGLVILLATAWGVLLLLGVLGARFRDLQPALVAGMNFMFVLTPVFWDPEQLARDRPMVTHLNPFYHFLEIVRAPLLGRTVAPESWAFCIIAMIAIIVLGCVAFARARRNLFNWV